MTIRPALEAPHLWQCVPAGTELHGNCASASRQAVNYIAVAHRSCLHAGEIHPNVCEVCMQTLIDCLRLISSQAMHHSLKHAVIGCHTRNETARQGLWQ